jgi:hypothetical protein
MDIILARKNIDGNGTFGVFLDPRGNYLYDVGERSYPNDDGTWYTKLPVGKWLFVRYLSPKHGYELFVCNDVPNHPEIEVHIGNFPQVDSEGCSLIGKSLGWTNNKTRMICNSTLAFKEFMALQKEVDSFTMTVE